MYYNKMIQNKKASQEFTTLGLFYVNIKPRQFDLTTMNFSKKKHVLLIDHRQSSSISIPIEMIFYQCQIPATIQISEKRN